MAEILKLEDRLLEYKGKIVKKGEQFFIQIPASAKTFAQKYWKKEVKVRIEVIE